MIVYLYITTTYYYIVSSTLDTVGIKLRTELKLS